MSHEKSETIILMFVYLELNLQGNKVTLAPKTAYTHILLYELIILNYFVMSWLIISCSSQLIVHFDMKPALWWGSGTYFSSCFRRPIELSQTSSFKGSPQLHQHSRGTVSGTGGPPCTHGPGHGVAPYTQATASWWFSAAAPFMRNKTLPCTDTEDLSPTNLTSSGYSDQRPGQ